MIKTILIVMCAFQLFCAWERIKQQQDRIEELGIKLEGLQINYEHLIRLLCKEKEEKSDESL